MMVFKMNQEIYRSFLKEESEEGMYLIKLLEIFGKNVTWDDWMTHASFSFLLFYLMNGKQNTGEM